jgi:hypothetical protein
MKHELDLYFHIKNPAKQGASYELYYFFMKIGQARKVLYI